MSFYVLMKILESTPERYETGIRMLSFGKIGTIHQRLVAHLGRDQRVLDLGCGTGLLTLKAASRGAHVKGIDVNPQMLAIARQRAEQSQNPGNVLFSELGVAELGSEKTDSYDAVMSSLCFSELTADELSFTLKEVKRILKPGGLLLVADEVKPANILKRTVYGLLRLPLILVTYLLTQTTTRGIKKLPEKIQEAGLSIESLRLNGMESFIELLARKGQDSIERGES